MPTSLTRSDTCWVKMADRRKLIASMLALTVFGALLLVPPLVFVFNQPISHGGIPQIVIYLFGIWLLLIVATAALSRLVPAERTTAGTAAEPD